jgi:hypothetical protein
VYGVERLAVACSCGDDINDPDCAETDRPDVLGRFFRSRRPGDVTPMTDLLIHCKKGDLAFPLELTLDLAMQGSLVGVDRQEDVGALLLELLKTVSGCAGQPPG